MIKNSSVVSNRIVEKRLIMHENEILKELRSHLCVGCVKGKMARKKLTGKIDYHVKKKMDMWVFDTMELRVATMDGCKYITVTMDVFTRKMWIGLHKTKAEIAEWLIELVKREQTQTGFILKWFHTDNGTEICTGTVLSFFSNQGTIHDTTTTYTPQHNSLVERRNRTLIEMMRAQHHHADSYLGLFGENALACNHILDRSLNSHHPTLTPLEHYTDRKPDTSHLHVWGCDAYFKLQKRQRDNKMSEKAHVGIFVGYDKYNDTYYRLLEVDALIVHRSRDVVFDEDKFEEMKRLNETMKLKEADINKTNDQSNRSVNPIRGTLNNNVNPNSGTVNLDVNPMRGTVNFDDYLPVRRIDDNEAIADMFPDTLTGMINESDTARKDNETVTNDDTDQRVYEKQNEKQNETNVNVESDTAHSNENKSDITQNDRNNSDTYRRTSRVTARPYRMSPSDYHSYVAQMNHRYVGRMNYRSFRMDANEYALLVLDEPITYQQAVHSEYGDKWQIAINEELDAHRKNKTFTPVTRTQNMNVIGCRWVFKVKRDAHGNVSKYKARLVAKGYNQEYGIDYHETFAPVLKYKSLRIIIVLSLHFNMRIEQLDVKTAFLNASVKEDIYISIPEGMTENSNTVLKLLKALYGIKQAPREWHVEIDTFLHSLHYSSCVKDTCLYWRKTKTNKLIIVGLFVDDITALFHDDGAREWNDDKQKLKSTYDLSELGDLHHILGMKVALSSSQSSSSTSTRQITVTQERYIQDKLELFNFDKCNIEHTPNTDRSRHSKITSSSFTDPSTKPLDDTEKHTYQMMVGSLIYASISTRPDITHAVGMVSRHMSNPTTANMTQVKRIYRYLSGTRSLGLTYIHHQQQNQQENAVTLTGYCDADWAGDVTDRKSTSGYCTMMNGNLISWQSKKQPTVALSSTEAEYMALTEAAKELMWMRMILTELNVSVVTPSIIYVDNMPAISVTQNDTHHDRLKHIDTRHYFIRDLVKDKIIDPTWISTHDQLADIFTKPLTAQPFITLRNKLMSDADTNAQ